VSFVLLCTAKHSLYLL